MTCELNNNTEQEFSSVYLSAQAPARKKQLHTIVKSKILMEHAIVGGDFNCVENVNLDVRYPAQGGSTYANASGQTLARLIAESGMIFSYRLVHGDAKTGYSRMAHTIHTRIDRIYTQAHNSAWRWQKVHSPPDTFTGNAASDHLPVIARVALAKERPPSATEAKINPAILENFNTRLSTKFLWTKQFEKFPPQEHGHAKAGGRKDSGRHLSLIRDKRIENQRLTDNKIKNTTRITHDALNKLGPSPILTAKINYLHHEIEQARKTFTHSSQSAKNKIVQEELLTKEFFTTFKSRTNNGDIAELYTTASWDSPVHEEAHTTDFDQEILRELRRYYVWLYSEKPSPDNEAPIKALRERPLQQSDIELMERPVTLYECKQAIRRLGLAKAARPDGLPAESEFYRSFEELVVKNLHNTLQEARTLGVLPRSMREGDIVLLHKKGDSRDPRNYRQTYHATSSRLQNTGKNTSRQNEKSSKEFCLQGATGIRS
jgi:hypothetical protein